MWARRFEGSPRKIWELVSDKAIILAWVLLYRCGCFAIFCWCSICACGIVEVFSRQGALKSWKQIYLHTSFAGSSMSSMDLLSENLAGFLQLAMLMASIEKTPDGTLGRGAAGSTPCRCWVSSGSGSEPSSLGGTDATCPCFGWTCSVQSGSCIAQDVPIRSWGFQCEQSYSALLGWVGGCFQGQVCQGLSGPRLSCEGGVWLPQSASNLGAGRGEIGPRQDYESCRTGDPLPVSCRFAKWIFRSWVNGKFGRVRRWKAEEEISERIWNHMDVR